MPNVIVAEEKEGRNLSGMLMQINYTYANVVMCIMQMHLEGKFETFF